MSVQAVVQAIREAGDAQTRSISASAETQAQEILANARADAQEIRQSAFQESVSSLAGERERVLSRAQREARCVIGEAQTRVLARSIACVEEHFQQVRDDPNYPQILEALVVEALERFKELVDEGESLCLIADPRDARWLDELLAMRDIAVEVRYSLSCWGGAVASSADGRVTLTNTLESRLKCADSTVRGRLLERLATGAVDDSRVAEVSP